VASRLKSLLFHLMILSASDTVYLNPLISSALEYLNSFTLGTDSTVYLATDYGLDAPGSNPGGDVTFHTLRPTLWPTPPPVK